MLAKKTDGHFEGANAEKSRQEWVAARNNEERELWYKKNGLDQEKRTQLERVNKALRSIFAELSVSSAAAAGKLTQALEVVGAAGTARSLLSLNFSKTSGLQGTPAKLVADAIDKLTNLTMFQPQVHGMGPNVEKEKRSIGNYFGVDGAKSLAESVGKLVDVTSFVLIASYQGFTDDGCVALGGMGLAKLRKLTSLTLDWYCSGIGPRGLVAVAAAIGNNKKLVHVDLDFGRDKDWEKLKSAGH